MSGNNETRRPATGAVGGPVLRCEDARILLMGYIDGELQPTDVRRIEELPVLDIDAAWETIYRRLERSAGWLLMSAGLTLLLGYSGWSMLNEFFLDPDVPFVVRLGAGGTLGGGLVLLVSIGREALTKFRIERYREVRR